MFYCFFFFSVRDRLYTFEVKNNCILHKTTKIVDKYLYSTYYTPLCFWRETFYGTYIAPMTRSIRIVQAVSLEKQTIERVADARAVFTFRHYSVCRKQEFVNQFANDILQSFLKHT